MAIKFFLVYLGGLFACSIVLFTLVKQFASAFATQGKKPLVYGTFSSVIASLAVYASTYITENLFTVFWIFAVIFLLFGIMHLQIVQKKYFTSESTDNFKVFIGEILFALSIILFTVLLFSSLQYFLIDKSFLFYPMMLSTFAFFIPLLFTYTFRAAYSIPAPVYNTWRYPEQPIYLPEDDPREKLLVIGFEIAKKTTDTDRTYFRAKAPESIYLGDLFYFFMLDYNELQSETLIEIADKKTGETYEWIFRLKTKWYQSEKVLDPSLTVKDNGIRENSVIICDRLIHT